MSVFRVVKNKNYSVMSNYHLKDKSLSLKTKGLLSIMLSLPDSWNYSAEGLKALSKDGITIINSCLGELESKNYLKRRRLFLNGKISDWEYLIYEKPFEESDKQEVENLQLENLKVENLQLENDVLLNTKELNTKEINTEEINTKKHKYGLHKNLLMTEAEYEEIKETYKEDYQKWIDKISEYVYTHKVKYKNYKAVIANWKNRENKTTTKTTKVNTIADSLSQDYLDFLEGR